MLGRTNIPWVGLALMTIVVACSGGAAGDAAGCASGSGGSHAAAVADTSLHCDGGGGPTTSSLPPGVRVVIEQEPFVCTTPCQTILNRDIDIACNNDWRLHVWAPQAPGVYDVGVTAHLRLVSGVDPHNPSACASHKVTSGTVEITSVSDVEVVGAVSNVSVDDAPGVDPNGPFTAPRCD